MSGFSLLMRPSVLADLGLAKTSGSPQTDLEVRQFAFRTPFSGPARSSPDAPNPPEAFGDADRSGDLGRALTQDGNPMKHRHSRHHQVVVTAARSDLG